MFDSRIKTSGAEKMLQITTKKESNIILVLSVSVPETLVKHICFYSPSVSVPTFNRDEPVMNGCSELSSSCSSHQHHCSVCYEILRAGRVTRSPQPALIHSKSVSPVHLHSVLSRLKQQDFS